MKDKSLIALVIFISTASIGPHWVLGASVFSSPSQGPSERRVGGPSPQAGPSMSRVVRRDGEASRSKTHSSATRRDFPGPKVIVVDDRDFSVSIQQTQEQVAPPEAKAAPEKKIYQPARWVKTEHGVEVLEPGRWVKAQAEY